MQWSCIAAETKLMVLCPLVGKRDQFGFEMESLQKIDKNQYCTHELSGGHLVLFLC